MSSSQQRAPRHPIAAFAARLHQVLDTLTGTPAWSMTPTEQRTALIELTKAQARLDALRLRVLAAADTADITTDTAATSTGAWLTHATRSTRGAAHADVKLAAALDRDHPVAHDALAAGLLDLGQTRVIVHAVDALPTTVTRQQRHRAEQHLVQLAADHDPAALKLLGRRVYEVLDPDAADAEEGKKLQAEETAAARATYLHLHDDHDGTHTGRFKIPTLHAAMLTKMLHALLSPTRSTTSRGTNGPATSSTNTVPARVSRPEQLGAAFAELLERFPADRLPTAGGMSATLVVLLDYDKLFTGLGAAHLDTGQPISAHQARRLACDAGIIPAVYQRVLGGPSVVLDLGRRTRLHTEPQRIALTLRDRGCTAESCDRPPSWCHAHHDLPWADGGPTSIDNGRLLCPHHHRKAHSPRYHTERQPDGSIRFHRRI